MSEDKIKLEIDGREINADKGQMLIEVTDKNDIYIPRFCYHKKLTVAETMYISGHSDPKMLLKTYNNLKLINVSKKINDVGEST